MSPTRLPTVDLHQEEADARAARWQAIAAVAMALIAAVLAGYWTQP